MKKLLLVAAVALGFGFMFSAPAGATIVTSTTTLASLPLKAAETNGIIVKACVVNAGAASNTFYFYDGSTLKFQVSVATASTLTVDFTAIMKEEWVAAGAFNVKAAVEDALGRVTCSYKVKELY